MLEDTRDVLVRDFAARYAVVSKDHNPNFYAFLSSDSRFALAFEGRDAGVFEIKHER